EPAFLGAARDFEHAADLDRASVVRQADAELHGRPPSPSGGSGGGQGILVRASRQLSTSEETRMARTNPRAALDVSRRDILMLCAAAPAAQLTPPGPGWPSPGGPRRGGRWRVGFSTEPATMDPHLPGSKIARQVSHNIYEPLVSLDVKLGIKPGLAESWQQPDS